METSRLIIDEVQKLERSYLLELISTILQLSYASYCEQLLWKFVYSNCDGRICNRFRPKDHTCCLFSIDEEYAWNIYYDDVIESVVKNDVWEVAKKVAHMIDITIDPSWYYYISELKKFPWTTIYLSILQFGCCADRTMHDSLTQILQVLANGPLNITRREKTIAKTSKISCPEEFRRKDEERMDTL